MTSVDRAFERPHPVRLSLERLSLAALVFALGLYAGLPWLAPVFMRLGWEPAGRALYAIYSTQCHQMAQRSFFLFGPKAMYSMGELARAGVASDAMALRAFLGSPTLGWKVAWSDRMSSMYLSLFFFSAVAFRLGRRLRPLPIGFALALLLPMAVDGGSHVLSDLAGLGQGFRDSNAWLASLTGNAFASSFYAGDALGSFNSWMRILSGIFFGLALAWAAIPSIRHALAGAED